jgi:hypothetical protein
VTNNQRARAIWRATTPPASTSEQAVPECAVLRRRAALAVLDQLCQRSRDACLVLRPIPQLQQVLTEPMPIWCPRHRVGVELLRSQDPAVRITRWQPRRTFGECPQQPAQRTSDAVTRVEADSRHGRQILHTPACADIRTRRRCALSTHNQRSPHLRAGKPAGHRSLRPARDRRRDTAQHPLNRSTPSGDPSRSWILSQRARHPEQIIDLNRRRHHPRRHDTHPRHGIEYAQRPRQPAPNQCGQRPQPPAAGAPPRTPAPLRRAGERSPGWLSPHGADKPCQPAGRSAQGTHHPCTPDPPPGSPTGAPRGDNHTTSV